MKNGILSVRELIAIKSFSRNGLYTENKDELVFFTVKPTNISVLSYESVAQKVRQLMLLLSAQPDIELICVDAKENYDANKARLDERIRDESSKLIRALLLKDREFLDGIQLQMSTAREFMFVVRLRNESDEQSFSKLSGIEKLINDRGFHCRRTEKEGIKRILSVYFGVNAPDGDLGDYDGEKTVSKWILRSDTDA